MSKPSEYEKMVLHGLYASFGDKEARMLMEGQRLRMCVPQTLPAISSAATEVISDEVLVEVADFEADRIGRYRHKIRGSLRPFDVESWVWVGRIS